MPHYQLNCEMIVPKPIDEVYEVFQDPYNLAIITPPWLNFLVTSKERVTMRLGAKIDYRFKWMGLPMYWQTQITSYDPPRRFTDEALRSPYVFWRHLHTFEPVEGGTLVRDRVDYQIPLGPIGRLAHSLAVKANLIQIFTYRQTTLDKYWGGGSKITWPTIQWTESQPLAPGIASLAGQSR